jgi:hypothetical protein
MNHLSENELRELIEIIVHSHGSSLSEEAFNDAVLMLFEDIAGMESCLFHHLYLDLLWDLYHDRRKQID